MHHNNIMYNAGSQNLRIGSPKNGIIVQESGWMNRINQQERISKFIQKTSITNGHHPQYQNFVQVYAISMADIEKALSKLEKQDPVINKEIVRKRLPKELVDLESFFDNDEGLVLPPHRPGRDHAINLKKDDQDRDLNVCWGPLYGMSRDELLVLRKTLTDLLGKGWIKTSSSPAGAPVLFVKKPGGGLRFCVDYRYLNAITRQDQYPLPLIRETLRNFAKARYFTKFDIRAAFHRLRIKKGE